MEMCEKPSSGKPRLRTAEAESPTTDDGECAGSSGIDESLGHGLGAFSEGRDLEHAIGPFHTTVLESTILSWKSFWDSGPMSRPILSAGMASAATTSGAMSSSDFGKTG